MDTYTIMLAILALLIGVLYAYAFQDERALAYYATGLRMIPQF